MACGIWKTKKKILTDRFKGKQNREPHTKCYQLMIGEQLKNFAKNENVINKLKTKQMIQSQSSTKWAKVQIPTEQKCTPHTINKIDIEFQLMKS